MTEFSRAHRAFGRRDREGDSDSAMNPSMGARTVHSGQLLKSGGSFWVFRMSNEFAGQYRQSEHQCQIPLRSDRNSIAMAGPLTNKISDSSFALGNHCGCCHTTTWILYQSNPLGIGPIATRSLQRGRLDQFNLDEAHFNILGE